ncbi:unnamed protein product [Aspergillus oryzae var. brunneus]|uniref:Unnamed protein product n=1 Tax=Aspergillus oryzae var. brunneus TaxID=332754 RepID=A0ABQ6KSQ5_ASPOZ|nr:unnamed protein product [Aspergillus oryzae var. brunneus]
MALNVALRTSLARQSTAYGFWLTCYPPVGCRGYGPLYAPHAFPGVQAGAQYDDNADQNLMVMVQIESRSGLDSVEEIAKVEGLDVLLIGRFIKACDSSHNEEPSEAWDEHTAAIDRILKAAKAAGKKAAIFCTSGEQARQYAEQGFDMVSAITDQGAMGDAMVQSLSAAQGRDADNKPRDGY